MSGGQFMYSQPSLWINRWLIDPCVDASPDVAGSLQAGLFAWPWTFLVGVLNGLMVNAAALMMGGGKPFAVLILIDASLAALRMIVFGRVRRNAALGKRTPTDMYLLCCIGWCAVQGAMGYCAMRTGIAPLQVICAMTVAGLVGPICMRNFGTPRFAIALVVVSLGPLVLGAVASHEPWLCILALQAPGFLFGASRMVRRLQTLTLVSLQTERESQERARRDPLTGLLNRAGLAEAVDRIEVSGATLMACLYLDLDGFKAINDCHGHRSGDEVLKLVAGRLSMVVGMGNVVARLGGDEFVVLAPGLTPEKAQALAGQLVHAVGGAPYCVGLSDSVRIGISIGLACAPEDGCEHGDLARKADSALYEAKFAGKNTHRRYDAKRHRPADTGPGKAVAA